MPGYTVHPGDIMVMLTGPEDWIVRVNDGVNDWVNDRVNKNGPSSLKMKFPVKCSVVFSEVQCSFQ